MHTILASAQQTCRGESFG